MRTRTAASVGFVAAVAVSAVVSTALSQPSGDTRAAPVTRADALDEFRVLWETGRSWTPPSGFVIELRRLLYARQSEGAIRERLAEIAPFPNHPDRSDLERDLVRATSGPDVYEITVWIEDPDRFRYSMTVHGSDGRRSLSDAVQSPAARWRLSEGPDGAGVLVVFEPGRPDPPAASLLGASESVRQHLSSVLTGGLASPFPEYRITGAEFRGDRLLGVAESEYFRTEFTFERSTLGGFDLIATESRQKNPPSRTGGRRITAWRSEPALGARIADRCELIGPDGSVREAIEFVRLRRTEPREFDRVSAVPAPDGHDVLRGRHTFTTIWDYRDNAGTITIGLGGESQTSPIPAEMRGSVPGTRLTRIGWFAAAAIVALLVGLKIRAQRRTASGQTG